MPRKDFSKGRKPDYWLKGMNKETNEKRKVGAAWDNPDGSISIDLDAFTVLESSPALVLTLFPIERGANTEE